MNKNITLRAWGPANLFGLGQEISAFLSEERAANGLLSVFSVGSTGAIVGLPDDEGVKDDFVNWVMKAIPYEEKHRHPGNAFAHLRSTVLKTNRAVPVVGGRPAGTGLQLLENTAGRKSRPIIFSLIKEGADVAFYRQKFTVKTQGWIDMVDITGRIMTVAAESGIKDGQIAVSSVSSRSPVITIENEMRLVLDTADFIDGLTRESGARDRKTAGHIGCAILGQSTMLPLEAGRPALGTWQQVMLVDLAEAGQKEIIVDIIGQALR